MKRFVFAVGSSGGKPLEATKKDAASFYTLLLANSVGGCHQDSPQPLLGCESVDDFNRELNLLLRAWNKEDQLIFYYSGHGEKRKNKYCLVLGNTSVDLLTFDSLAERFELSGVEKAIIVLDACAAGQATKGSNEFINCSESSMNPEINDADLPDGMAIIASSGPAQFSWQNAKGDASVFTEVLLKTLHEGIDNGEEFVFVEDVVERVAETINSDERYAEFQQSPVFSMRGSKRIWLARNIAYSENNTLNLEAKSDVYSITDLELLAVERLLEEHPSKVESLDDLDWSLVSKYRDASDRLDVDSDLPATQADLQRLGLLSPIQVKARHVPHRSAAICFCNRPDRFHPESISIYLDMSLGNGKFVRKEILGPLLYQLLAIQDLVKSKIDVHSYIDENGERQERAEIDLELFREVLANAFVHRDFSISGSVEVRITKNWVEISNPGCLLFGKKLNEVLEKTFRSVPRNPVLMLLMNRLRRTEQIGRGFELIRDCIRDNGEESIQCSESNGPITVFRLLRRRQTIKDNRDIKVSESKPLKKVFLAPRRNSFFKGRENDLEKIHESIGESGPLGPVISGMGGVGKTQIALQYAWHYRAKYESVLWVQAENEETLTQGFTKIAEELQLSYDVTKAESSVSAVKKWLESNQNWLLVIDNADNPKLLSRFIPVDPKGRIIITSRAKTFDEFGISSTIEIGQLSDDMSLEFLLKRSGKESVDAIEEQAAKHLIQEVAGLPLALEQIAAYIKGTNSPFSTYLDLFRAHPLEVLEKRGPEASHYMQTIATTWSVNMEQLDNVQRSIMHLSSFLAPNNIPFELIENGRATIFNDSQGENITELTPVRELLEPLQRFSLISLNEDNNSYNVHRLVQAVTKQELNSSERLNWLNRTISLLLTVYPAPDKIENWPTCERYSTHVSVVYDELHRAELVTEEIEQLLTNTGWYHMLRGKYSQAEPMIQSANDIIQKIRGISHPDSATSLNNLATFYQATGQYAEALPLYKQALAIRQELLGIDHPKSAESLDNLAVQYSAKGNYEKAEPLLKQSLEIRHRILGADHPDTGASYNNLASNLHSQGRYEEAEQLFRLGLEIRQRELGDHHPDTATSYNNVAYNLHSKGRYREAELLFRRGLKVRQQVLGEEHPDTATSYNSVASNLSELGRYEEAETLFRQGLEIRQRVLGEEHPSTATSYDRMAYSLSKQGRYKEAEALLRQGLEIRQQILGEKHPDTYTSFYHVASNLIAQGRQEEAKPLLQSLLKIHKKLTFKNHPAIPEIRHSLTLITNESLG